MRYKVILSNTDETITIREEELEAVLNGINNKSIVMVLEGIFNPSYFIAIVMDEKRMRDLAEAKRLQTKLSEPSPFAKLLGKKMGQLPSQLKSGVDMEVAKLEREIN